MALSHALQRYNDALALQRRAGRLVTKPAK
jgi:hypothetical protein